MLVLYLPFVAAVLGTMWALHGNQTFVAFETVFFDPDAAAIAQPGWALALGIVAVLTFAPLNAPVEEAIFRGYAQSRLSGSLPMVAVVLVCSIAFGLQHAFFAPTPDAMIVYVVAFTVWGIGSSPAVIFPALQFAGVIPG